MVLGGIWRLKYMNIFNIELRMLVGYMHCLQAITVYFWLLTSTPSAFNGLWRLWVNVSQGVGMRWKVNECLLFFLLTLWANQPRWVVYSTMKVLWGQAPKMLWFQSGKIFSLSFPIQDSLKVGVCQSAAQMNDPRIFCTLYIFYSLSIIYIYI